MQIILGYIIILIMIIGIALVFVYRKKSTIAIIVISCIVLGLPLLLFANNGIYKSHKAEINRVIEARGGIVHSIKKDNSNMTPFKSEVRSSNRVYKIMYQQNNQYFTAWYRGGIVLNDIHAKPKKGFEEKWVFDEQRTFIQNNNR